MKVNPEKTIQIYSIGHSNRSFDEFVLLLKEFDICVVADIRRYPGSQRFPHFNRKELCELLDAKGIGYVWLEALGGRRHNGTNDSSQNTGLKSQGFRNYADHMATDEFHAAVEKLLSTAAMSRPAVMCAEKLYWKCHRRFLSDYLVGQGAEVLHIIEEGKVSAHKMTPGAVITATAGVIYPLAGCV